MDDSSESFYSILMKRKKDIIHVNKSFDKIIVNIVKIEITYLKFHLCLYSKSKLYKPIKTDHIEKALWFSST